MDWDLEVDWLVAGAGAAGMTGAVVAHQLGGTVLVVEKESLYGGTTAKSGGVAWVPANHRQAQAGIADTVAEGYSYLKGLIGESVPDARVRAYAERAREMLQFMMRHSRVDYSAIPNYMDYYENVAGYNPAAAPWTTSRSACAPSARRRGTFASRTTTACSCPSISPSPRDSGCRR
ncbi:MAG: FAD-binding protein [Halioglobus sp.]|nr:FAD-binding protein [Halioglobus sp.]